MNRITPEKDLKKELLRVSMPGRYVGGEYGSIIKENAHFRIALCFPDLYEIGMSNQAVKILYEMINTETEASCERVFSPAPDFEGVLRDSNIPLYTLETGADVRSHDILAFTIGYELCATNILNVLELSNIPLLNKNREDSDPIVIAGGPAATNPVPFGSFIDAVYIGEAEGMFKELLASLCLMKEEGASREEILEIIRASEYFWWNGKKAPVKKAIWNEFGIESKARKMLVPSIKTVQDHGVVEIMRGCPNGCRFCHAGIYYRPFREKSVDNILDEVDALVRDCGYREITLSSLSSGDYSYIRELIKILNSRYSDKKISFSFPSMRVNSFTLPLISEISKVRKSGLTFAVETPDDFHQRGLNKEVPLERVIEILNEAKKMGWNKAKFYFMVGLPFFENDDETDSIINYLREVGRKTKLQLNVNIGTFIPKPHTPFQWAFQLTEKKGFEKLIKIKRALPSNFFKVGFQSPFMSFLEGIICRGDERAGELIINAFNRGARLDAWEEYLDKDIWREVIAEAEWDVEKEICSPTDVESVLPWDGLNLNAGKKFLKDELQKANKGELTSACSDNCDHQCGACNEQDKVIVNKKPVDVEDYILNNPVAEAVDEQRKVKILFSFKKIGKAVFISHINVMTVFERAFLRAGIKIRSSEGFNPKPKLEFANPLTLGFSSNDEIAAIEIMVEEDKDNSEIENKFTAELNRVLPEGIIINRAKIIKSLASEETGKKVMSLMASYNGGYYSIKCEDNGKAESLHGQLCGMDGVECDFNEDDKTILRVNTYKSENGKILNFFKFLKDTAGYENPFDYYDIFRMKTHSFTGLTGKPADSLDYFESYL